jgi:hypothetical protein
LLDLPLETRNFIAENEESDITHPFITSHYSPQAKDAQVVHGDLSRNASLRHWYGRCISDLEAISAL